MKTLEEMISDLIDENARLKYENYMLKKENEKIKADAENGNNRL